MPKIVSSLFVGWIVSLAACSPMSRRYLVSAPYVAEAVPTAPDYGAEASWAALPGMSDPADGLPEGSDLVDRQGTSPADVFFVYPTVYTDEPAGRFPWNASVTDERLNERIDRSTIKLQASLFNGAGRVYAPRYRQAQISAYYTTDTLAARSAFDTAYADLRNAFRHYLERYNENRPFIIASHSQGTTLGKRLVREFIDGTPLAGKLVVAYLVGIPVEPYYFSALPVCEDSTQTGCFVSWRTWQRPALPATSGPAVVVNPLSWGRDTALVPRDRNLGGTLRKLKLQPGLTDAQVHGNVLWINRPHFFGKRLIKFSNWHVADYNLFYANVRANAWQRVRAYVAGEGGE